MKKYFLFSFLTALLLGSVLAGTAVFAQDYGLGATAGAAKLPMNGDLPTLIGNVIGTALSMIGVLFFGLMIYGGILWMTDRGKEEQAKKAFDTIVAAVIGIIIVLASYAITRFAFSSVAPQTPPPVTSLCTGAVGLPCQDKNPGDACQTSDNQVGVCSSAPGCVCNVSAGG